MHLAIWHGWNLELALSGLALGGGLALFIIVDRGWVSLASRAGLPDGERMYLLVLRGLARGSRRVTGIVQNGSLPVYAGVILATAAALPAWVVAAEWGWSGWPAVTPIRLGPSGPRSALPQPAKIARASAKKLSVNPSRTRRLKNAECEVDFFFISGD